DAQGRGPHSLSPVGGRLGDHGFGPERHTSCPASTRGCGGPALARRAVLPLAGGAVSHWRFWCRVVGEITMTAFQKILVPTDGSSCSKEAIRTASELASGLGASLTLVYFFEPFKYALPEGYVVYTPEQLAEMVD